MEWVPFFLLRRLCSSIKRDPSPPPPPLIFPFFVFFFHQECQWHQLASQPPTQPCCFPSFYSVDKRANVRRLRTVKTFVNQLFIFPSTAYSSKGVGCPHGNLCLIPAIWLIPSPCSKTTTASPTSAAAASIPMASFSLNQPTTTTRLLALHNMLGSYNCSLNHSPSKQTTESRDWPIIPLEESASLQNQSYGYIRVHGC